jgi:hypothetical protein
VQGSGVVGIILGSANNCDGACMADSCLLVKQDSLTPHALCFSSPAEEPLFYSTSSAVA